MKGRGGLWDGNTVLPMSSVKPFQITFDCADPVRIARFWAEVLGYRAEWDELSGPAASY